MIVAPHGQDDVPQLQSVFEFPHLRQHAHFLDTQCKLVSQLLCSSDRPNSMAQTVCQSSSGDSFPVMYMIMN